VRFVVDEVALGQVFSEYFGFPRLLHIHHHLLSGAGMIGQIVADVPSGLILTPPKETIKIRRTFKMSETYNDRLKHQVPKEIKIKPFL
jgi:hypothetical protein